MRRSKPRKSHKQKPFQNLILPNNKQVYSNKDEKKKKKIGKIHLSLFATSAILKFKTITNKLFSFLKKFNLKVPKSYTLLRYKKVSNYIKYIKCLLGFQKLFTLGLKFTLITSGSITLPFLLLTLYYSLHQNGRRPKHIKIIKYGTPLLHSSETNSCQM